LLFEQFNVMEIDMYNTNKIIKIIKINNILIHPLNIHSTLIQNVAVYKYRIIIR